MRNKVPDLALVTGADLAGIVYQAIWNEFKQSPSQLLEMTSADAVMKACSVLLRELFPDDQEGPCLYILIDDIETLFGENERDATRNRRALNALEEFLEAVIYWSERDASVYRIVLPRQFKDEIKESLGSKIGRVTVIDDDFKWTARACKAVISRRLEVLQDHVVQRKPINKNDDPAAVFVKDTLDEIEKWMAAQSHISPRCVIRLLDRFCRFAFDKNVPPTQSIPPDLWEVYCQKIEFDTICPNEPVYPLAARETQ